MIIIIIEKKEKKNVFCHQKTAKNRQDLLKLLGFHFSS